MLYLHKDRSHSSFFHNTASVEQFFLLPKFSYSVCLSLILLLIFNNKRCESCMLVTKSMSNGWFTLPGTDSGADLGLWFQTRWLHCTMQSIPHCRLGSPTLYFCIGRESKSEFVSGNVNEPYRLVHIDRFTTDTDVELFWQKSSSDTRTAPIVPRVFQSVFGHTQKYLTLIWNPSTCTKTDFGIGRGIG